MKSVVGISLGAAAQDFAFTATFLGEKLHVQRLGTDGSTARAVALVRQWDSKADAIGLGVLKDRYRAGSHRFVEKDSAKLKAVAKQALTTIGGRLSDILQEWSVRHAQIQLGNYFNNARVVFLSGMTNYKLAMSMAEYTDNVMFADPLLQLGVPKFLTSIEALQLYSTGAHYVKDWSLPVDLATGPIKEWTRFVLRKAVQKATVLVAAPHELDQFGLEELAGKTIISTTVNDERIAQLKDKGVHMVIDAAPVLFNHVLSPSLLDAMIVAATGKFPQEILEDDYLKSSPAWAWSRASSIPTASSA